jgi:hypothetical protein
LKQRFDEISGPGGPVVRTARSFWRGCIVPLAAAVLLACGSYTVVLPTVTTDDVVATSPASARVTGTLLDDGGGESVVMGGCWGPEENPTLADSWAECYMSNPTSGVFMVSAIGLTPGMVYHARAFAQNSVGTAYGLDLQFETPAAEQARRLPAGIGIRGIRIGI